MNNFTPILTDIVKLERKFTCTKPHLLFDFLEGNTEYIDSYELEQKFFNSAKYRKYTCGEKTTFVKHYLRYKDGIEKHVGISEIEESEYEGVPDTNKIKKTRSAYKICNTQLLLNVDILAKNRIIVEIWTTENNKDALEEYIAPKGLEEVTEIQYFENKYIATSSDSILDRPLIIVEGTDLIGKSTVVKELIKLGYNCLDRDQHDFSDYILLNKHPMISAEQIKNAYINEHNYVIVALYTSDNNILGERFSERLRSDSISPYDEQCGEYNLLYIRIIQELCKFNEINIIPIDIVNRSTQDIINIILEAINNG